MANTTSLKEVETWLKCVLSEEQLRSTCVKLTGEAKKGSGYVAEIVRAEISGIDNNGVCKQYNLLLKCSTSNTVLLNKSPALFGMFLNEIHVYENVFPIFTQFQIEKGIQKPMDSLVKCYGVFTSPSKNVIVLEDLNKLDYHLWDQKKPLTKKHIDLVVDNYGKFHATSVAIMEQYPEKFQTLVDGFQNVFNDFLLSTGFVDAIEEAVEETYYLLENELEGNILRRWLDFKNHIRSVFFDVVMNITSLKVIVHGDCWNNNFMFKYENAEKSSVSKVAILDWQVSRFSTPIIDLSYFLFSCSSKEDIENLAIILQNYHNSFTSYLQKLGSNFAKKYPLDCFLNDWKTYGKYGLAMCILPVKVAFADTENIPDMNETVKKREDIKKSFFFKISDIDNYKKRMLPIVKYVVENGLV